MNEEKKEPTIVEAKNENVISQYDEVQVAKKVERTDSFYDGKLLEIIGYSILSYIITIFTLGLASAWAEKLLIAYNVEHTVYNGKRLKFEGTGASLFVQKFKWIFFTIITLGIYSFWIPIKKQKWISSNIHYEKEEFVKGESYFTGGLLGLIGVNLFCKILTIISLGLLYPFGICYKQKWITKHSVINRKKIVFDGTAISLIGHYLLWWILCIITFGIYGLWLPIKIEQWKVKNTHIKLKNEQEPNISKAPAIIGIILTIILLIVTVFYTSKYIESLPNNNFNIEEIFENFEKDRNGSEQNLSKYDGKSYIDTKGYVRPVNITQNNNNTNNKSYSESDYYRYTKLTLIDGVLCYGYQTHEEDLIAQIENNDISLSQGMGAVQIKNANAKYLYSVAKYAADVVDLYFITNNNELYVIYNPNANDINQNKVKVTNSSVAEFLGTETKDNGQYIKVLLTDGSTEDILYLEYNN